MANGNARPNGFIEYGVIALVVCLVGLLFYSWLTQPGSSFAYQRWWQVIAVGGLAAVVCYVRATRVMAYAVSELLFAAASTWQLFGSLDGEPRVRAVLLGGTIWLMADGLYKLGEVMKRSGTEPR